MSIVATALVARSKYPMRIESSDLRLKIMDVRFFHRLIPKRKVGTGRSLPIAVLRLPMMQ